MQPQPFFLFGRGPKLSAHERLTALAFEAYNSGNYDEAIKAARECIDDFKTRAETIQKGLKEQNSPEPPTGKVESKTREKIHENGPLNDVATSYWILGRSLEKKGKKAEAIQALRECAAPDVRPLLGPRSREFLEPLGPLGPRSREFLEPPRGCGCTCERSGKKSQLSDTDRPGSRRARVARPGAGSSEKNGASL